MKKCLKQVREMETMCNKDTNGGGFDWLAYKATVAAGMLRPIYEETKKNAKNGGIRSASDMAIDEAIEMAVNMAERLEKRLKGG